MNLSTSVASLAAAVSSLCLTAPLLARQDPPKAPDAPAAVREGLLLRTADAFDGYTLFAPLQSGTTYLIDMDGKVAHEWKHGFGSSANYLLDNGRLLFISRVDDNPVFFGGGIGGRIRELEWNGDVAWEYVLSTDKRILHHDIELLPNGNVLAIAWEHLTPAEAVARGRDPKQLDKHGLWPDVVIEIQPTRPSGGKIVWEWRAADHFVQDFDDSKAGFGAIGAFPGRIDINGEHRDTPPMSAAELERWKEDQRKLRELGYAGGEEEADPDAPAEKRRPGGDMMHLNSVDYHAEHDLIVVSSPRFHELWIIDHSTTTEEARGNKGGRWGKGGEILYRWGNPRMYGAGTREDQMLFGQHQPEWIPDGSPGAGNLLVFNNGDQRKSGDYSTVDELVLPFDPKRGFTRAAGQAYGPKAPVWSYSAPKREDFFSFFISGAQRLPNGNTLICSGQQGRLFEVTNDNRIVWEYLNPYGGDLPASFGGADPNKGKGPGPVRPTSVFRATRIAPDHAGVAKLRR